MQHLYGMYYYICSDDFCMYVDQYVQYIIYMQHLLSTTLPHHACSKTEKKWLKDYYCWKDK